MQNAQIWKSIEALCNEAESVIKNSEPVITVIQSIAPPAPARQGTSKTNAGTILSSEPAPPKAKTGNRYTSQESIADDPLSHATMAEIAAAIDRASQSAQKPQIIEQPAQGINNQLRKDLMIEVSLAVRSVLENELPKMVHHAISNSLYKLIDSSSDPRPNDFRALPTKPRPRYGKKKVTDKNKSVQITAADLNGMSKRELEDLGREYGVELDRRYKKSTLVEQMKNIIQ